MQRTLFDPTLYEGYPSPQLNIGRPVRLDCPGHPADGLLGEITETEYDPLIGLVARVRLERQVCAENGDWFGTVSARLSECNPL